MDSFIDGVASGLGFLVGLSILGIARELIGTGAVDFFGFYIFRVIDAKHSPTIFVESSGAFLMFGLLAWVMNTIKDNKEKQVKDLARAAAKEKAAKIAKVKAAAAAKAEQAEATTDE